MLVVVDRPQRAVAIDSRAVGQNAAREQVIMAAVRRVMANIGIARVLNGDIADLLEDTATERVDLVLGELVPLEGTPVSGDRSAGQSRAVNGQGRVAAQNRRQDHVVEVMAAVVFEVQLRNAGTLVRETHLGCVGPDGVARNGDAKTNAVVLGQAQIEDLVSVRAMAPLCVLGLTLVIARSAERDMSQTSALVAAMLNFLLPFAILAVCAISILGSAALARWQKSRRSSNDTTPVMRTLPFFVLLAFPVALTLEAVRHALFDTGIDIVRAGWISFLLALSWEFFAVYLVTTVLTPVKAAVGPLNLSSEEDRSRSSQEGEAKARTFGKPRLCVIGSRPLALGPQEAWHVFWRPEIILPLALVWACLTTGFALSSAMNGQPWFPIAIFHIVLNSIFLTACVLPNVTLAWLLTESACRRPPERGPVNIYSISFLMPLSYAAAYLMELAQIVLYGQTGVDLLQFLTIGTVLTLMSEACATYIVTVGVPVVRAKARLQAEGTPATEAPANSAPAPFVGAQPAAQAPQPGLVLLVTGCKPFPFGHQEAWHSVWRPEFLLPQAFLGLCIAAGISQTIVPAMQAWIWFTAVQLILTVTCVFCGVFLYMGYGWIRTKLRARSGHTGPPPRIYSLAIVVPVCIAFAGINEFTHGMFDQSKSFETSRFIQQSILFTVLGEMSVIYLVKLGIPIIRSKRLLKEQRTHLATMRPHPASQDSAPKRLLKIRDKAVAAEDPVMLNAEGNYIRVVEKERNWLTNGPLFEILDALDYEGGIQVHRSTWVALAACQDVKRENRKLYIILKDNTHVTVARGREKAVKEIVVPYLDALG